MTCFVSTKSDGCVQVLWIRHLVTNLHQVNTVSPNPSLHAAPDCHGCSRDRRKRCPQTKNWSNRHPLHAAHAQHGPDKTLFQPSAGTNTSSLSSLHFCPPRLNHLLQFRKLLECGFCSMSPLCVTTAIQTGEVHGNSGLVHFHPNCKKKTHPKTLASKNTFIQKHFRPKTEDNFIYDTFIQKWVHPLTLSSKNGFVQKLLSSKNTFIQKHFHPKTLSSKNRRQFHLRHFHPKMGSSIDTFIQKRFRPMTLSS